MLNLKHKPFAYEESENPWAIAARYYDQISEELHEILERLDDKWERRMVEEKAYDIFTALSDPEDDDIRKGIIRAGYRAYSWVSVMFTDDAISFEEWRQLKNYMLALTEEVLQMAEN